MKQKRSSGSSKDPLASSISSITWSTNSAYQSSISQSSLSTSSQYGSSNNLNNTTASAFMLFDSDNKFLKFIQFSTDYVLIINENILNQPCKDTTYDLNDELSIFIFNLLINILSIGLVS